MSVCVCVYACTHAPTQKGVVGQPAEPPPPQFQPLALGQAPLAPHGEPLGQEATVVKLWSAVTPAQKPPSPWQRCSGALCSPAGPMCTQTGAALAPRLGQTSQAQRCVGRGRRKGTRRDGGQWGGLPSVCLRLAHAQRTGDTRTVRNRKPAPRLQARGHTPSSGEEADGGALEQRLSLKWKCSPELPVLRDDTPGPCSDAPGSKPSTCRCRHPTWSL